MRYNYFCIYTLVFHVLGGIEMIKRISFLLIIVIVAQCLFASSNEYKLSISTISNDSDSVRYSFDGNGSWFETEDDVILVSKDEVDKGKIYFQKQKDSVWNESIASFLSFVGNNAKNVDLTWSPIQNPKGSLEWSLDAVNWNAFSGEGRITLNNIPVGELTVLYLRDGKNGQVSDYMMIGSATLSNKQLVKSYRRFSVSGGTSFSLRDNRFQSGESMTSKGTFGGWIGLSVNLSDWFALSLKGNFARHIYKPFTVNEVVGEIKAVFMLPNYTHLTPYVALGVGEGYFWNNLEKVFNPSLCLSLGTAYSINEMLSIILSASYSATLTHDALLNPNSLIDSVNHRLGVNLGCAVSFGKGGNV